jgi:hypothetical protein
VEHAKREEKETKALDDRHRKQTNGGQQHHRGTVGLNVAEDIERADQTT